MGRQFPSLLNRCDNAQVSISRFNSLFMFNRWSLRARLLVNIAIVLTLALALGGLLMLRHARSSVQVEMQSNLRMVQQLIGVYLADPNAELSDPQLESVYGAIARLRHVHAIVTYVHGWAPSGAATPSIADVPDWFVRLIAPPAAQRANIVLYGPGQQRKLIIETNPVDEIREVWHDLLPLAELVVGMCFGVCLVVYWTLGRCLKPLGDLAVAIERLERDEASVPVTEAVVPELAAIHRRFNAMARRLRLSMETNRDLANRLVVLQEGERKALARELHDEMGPSLFNIQVDVTTGLLLMESGQLDDVRSRFASIESSVTQLQAQTRDMIGRLRPLVLEELGLGQVLRDMVDKWRGRYPDTQWHIHLDGGLDDLGDPLTVTVYRIVQECLTNVVKHAGATCVDVALVCESGGDDADSVGHGTDGWLTIRVRDNGTGPPGTTLGTGFGLRGMQERVMALQGAFQAQRCLSGGFETLVRLPLRRDYAAHNAAS